jgi:hypothetical protein
LALVETVAPVEVQTMEQVDQIQVFQQSQQLVERLEEHTVVEETLAELDQVAEVRVVRVQLQNMRLPQVVHLEQQVHLIL